MTKQKTVFSGVRTITKKVIAREDIDAKFKSTVKAIEQDVLVVFR